ncbi:MAG: hypothetical protein QM723_14085 [Myxococcaceae bacterium]
MALTLKAAEKLLREVREDLKQTRRLEPLLRDPPPKLDAKLFGETLAGIWREPRPYLVFRHTRRVPASVIRVLLEKSVGTRHAHALFTEAFIDTSSDDASVVARWAIAVRTVFELCNNRRWGDRSIVNRVKAIAKDRELLEAVRVAAADPEADPKWLAVLARDGADESLDALLPHVERAASEKSGRPLGRLSALRVHANESPKVLAMLDHVEKEIAQRHARSPLLDLVETIGVPRPRSVRFRLAASAGHATRRLDYYLGVTADSAAKPWLRVTLYCPALRGSTMWSSDGPATDTLGLGSETPRDLPKWIAATEAKLGVTFPFATSYLVTNLRGQNPDRLRAWLASARG